MILSKNVWRDTARPVRCGFLDARALTGFFLWMLHMSWPTFWLSLAVLLLFVVLERLGITVPAALRWCRQSFFSPIRRHDSHYTLRRPGR